MNVRVVIEREPVFSDGTPKPDGTPWERSVLSTKEVDQHADAKIRTATREAFDVACEKNKPSPPES